jgi:hypothetical protein
MRIFEIRKIMAGSFDIPIVAYISEGMVPLESVNRKRYFKVLSKPLQAMPDKYC